MEFHTLTEIARRARINLAQGPWDYLAGGSETETTLKRNRMAIDEIAFRPRVLRDVSTVDVSSTFLGHETRLPVFLAPVGHLQNFTTNAAADAATAAVEFGVPQFLSSVSPPSLEGVTEINPKTVFQLYVHTDADGVDREVDRAHEAGCIGFCLTVDTAWYSRRERDILNRRDNAWARTDAAGTGDLAALNWSDVARIRERCTIPLMIKGVATPEDAILAVEHGVDVVYVSNHGGRQLDHGLGSMHVVEEIMSVVGDTTVVVDGGFMRGTDVLKAMALGVHAVGIGRVACLGLAADGPAGLVRVLELLEDEMKRSSGLLGVTDLSQLDRTYLADGPVVSEPSVFSALPLLDDAPPPGQVSVI